jgi:hypothetical protein
VDAGLWFALMLQLALADTGDSAACEDSITGGTLRGGVCVVDLATCCQNGCWDYFGDVVERGKWVFDCSSGSDVAHVYLHHGTEFYDHYWFDTDGALLGWRSEGAYCCEGRLVGYRECGIGMGTCLVPLVSQRSDDAEPEPPGCPPVVSDEPETQPDANTGCAVGSTYPATAAILLACAALLRRRPW